MSSTTSTRSTGPTWAAISPERVAGSRMRSTLYLTASALKGVPSWNTTPLFSVNVHSSATSFDDQLAASAGWNSPSGPRISSGSAIL